MLLLSKRGRLADIEGFQAIGVAHEKLVVIYTQTLRTGHGVGAHQLGVAQGSKINDLKLIYAVAASIGGTAEREVGEALIYHNRVAAQSVLKKRHLPGRLRRGNVINVHAALRAQKQVVVVGENGFDAKHQRELGAGSGRGGRSQIEEAQAALIHGIKRFVKHRKPRQRTGFTRAAAHAPI
ncbi:TraY domain-containing protein [Hymenobacter radiodurans]|uniref:TraY domain-containing protein n=1 Tax=Hymenobacter radiodurans TaxID=2496028 RepID=UPI0037423518